MVLLLKYGEYEFDFGKTILNVLRYTMQRLNMVQTKGIVKEDLYDFDRAKATAERLGIEVQKSWGLGSIVNAILKKWLNIT